MQVIGYQRYLEDLENVEVAYDCMIPDDMSISCAWKLFALTVERDSLSTTLFHGRRHLA